MFDVTSPQSYTSGVPFFYRIVRNITRMEGVPVALCGSNAHSNERKIKTSHVSRFVQDKANLEYFDLFEESEEVNNFANPFGFLTGREDLFLIHNPLCGKTLETHLPA